MMYTDDCFIVINVMQMMNVIQLQAHLREVRGSKCHVRPFQTLYSVVSLLENLYAGVPEHPTRHRLPPLTWPRSVFTLAEGPVGLTAVL